MKKFIFSVAAALIIAGCASTTKSGAVGVNRSQVMLVSAQEMDKGAAMAYTKVLKESTSKKTLNTDPVQTKRVQKITGRLIDQVDVFRADAKTWNWQVNVIKDDTVNAWCMPGGRIAVYTGIIDKLKLNDAELAAIVGHEMSHALREHSREKASRDQIKNVGIYAVGIATGSNEIANLANMAATYTIALPFSREQETEADNMGTELMARAGYDPKSSIDVWKKMAKLNSQQPMEFMSTHPSHASRIANLTAISNKLEPIYQQAKKS